MADSSRIIQENIIRSMAEGVMSIGFNGVINFVNPIALEILGLSGDCVGKKFAQCFFDSDDNDAFTQMVLDVRCGTGQLFHSDGAGCRVRQVKST